MPTTKPTQQESEPKKFPPDWMLAAVLPDGGKNPVSDPEFERALRTVITYVVQHHRASGGR